MAITSAFTNIATTTRASKAWDPGAWDFVNGSAVGALVEYAANAPRITSSGLMVEESTTNGLANPRCETITAGDITGAGALPTGWTVYENSAVVPSVVANGYEDGWPYLEMSFVGTGAAGTVSLIHFAAASATAALADQTWTGSAGYKITGGSLAGVSNFQQYITSYNGGPLVQQFNTEITPDTTHKRSFFTQTVGSGTIDSIANGFRVIYDGTACNLTIRIYAPQMEQKAYPTSPVLPTAASPAASTRNGEFPVIASGSHINATAHTMFIEAQTNGSGAANGGSQVVAGYSPVSFNDAAYFTIDANNDPGVSVRSGGSSYMSAVVTDGVQTAAGQTIKLAVAIAANDAAFSVSGGGTQATDSTITMPTGSPQIVLGARPWSSSVGNSLNGYIKDFGYWPRRLTNAELEALVGN